jgi:hypothetical protein
MMNEPVITCPNCQSEIKLTESLAAPLVEAERERAREERDRLVDARVKKEQHRIAEEAAAKVRQDHVAEIEALRKDLAEKNVEITTARTTELELRRERSKLEEEKRQIELTVERRLDAERDSIRNQVRKEDDERFRGKIAEKDKVISDMRTQLDEARRKSEQGSQQTQGDVAEMELESLLKARFPFDDVEQIGKGREGGDRLQHVHSGSGPSSGSILWERKRTKAWANDWLEKARDDQRAAKADLVVIVTDTLPKDVATFDRVEGVWVTSPINAMPLAGALRHGLIECGAARRAIEGRQEKESLVYAHVTGPGFRGKIGLMVESILSLHQQHQKEKAAMMRIWTEREKQLDRLMSGTASIYGGFRGIVGATLPEVKELALPETANDLAEEVIDSESLVPVAVEAE